MTLNSILEIILAEKIVGGEGEKIIFNDLWDYFLNEIKNYNIKTLDSNRNTYTFEKKYDGQYLLEKLIPDIINDNGDLIIGDYYIVDAKEKNININDVSDFIVKVNIKFNTAAKIYIKKGMLDIKKENNKFLFFVDANIDLSKDSDSISELEADLRHETQHMIQLIVTLFKEKEKLLHFLHNKNNVSFKSPYRHYNNPVEHDARITDFFTYIKNKDWYNLFKINNGLFSYERGYSVIAEYFKYFNKKQILTKLYQLGLSNEEIQEFKKQFKHYTSLMVEYVIEKDPEEVEEKIKVALLIMDLVTEKSPLYELAQKFGLNDYTNSIAHSKLVQNYLTELFSADKDVKLYYHNYNTNNVARFFYERVNLISKDLYWRSKINFKDFFTEIDESLKINEEYPLSFDIIKFKGLTSFKSRKEYCDEHLTKLAAGSSRIVYRIDNEKVLKLAKNKKGIDQNETEVDMYNDYLLENLVAPIYDYEESFLWVEMAIAEKMSKSIFQNMTGVSFDEYSNYLDNFNYETKKSVKATKELLDKIDDNEFLSDMIFYVSSYDVLVGDYKRLSSYGIIKRNGKKSIVLIDYGLNDTVYTKHYKK